MSVTHDLAAYALPGRVTDPRLGITHAIEAERIGLGQIWLSERFETKETGATCGAVAQATKRIEIVAGLTNFTARHPLLSAGLGTTMQLLSGNRFAMGMGRSVAAYLKMVGLPVYKLEHMAEYATLLRQLWAGETVNYDGILGKFPRLSAPEVPDKAPPLILGAVGPKTLALGGRLFDAVVLHPLLTTDAVARSAQIVRDAAKEAGRDPASVKVIACIVTGADNLTAEEFADAIHARTISYMVHRALGLPIIQMNGWDEEPMNRLIDSGLGFLELQKGDNRKIRAQLAEAIKMLPDEWITTGTAVGTVEQCAARWWDYRKAGADQILIHGTTPERLENLVRAYAAQA